MSIHKFRGLRFSIPFFFAACVLAVTRPAHAQAETQAAKPKASGNSQETTIGGYGEIAYNAYANDESRNQVDMKRFVLFLGHSFNEHLSLSSEVEWEHAITSASDEGETEIEQAFLNYRFNGDFNLKMGLFLMPFGLLNKSHEPPVFSGVERNEVETRIIPSTWREGGIGLYGSTGFGLAWDAGVTTGFDLAKFEDASQPLRGIHQELQLAKAADFSGYAALNYVGIPGFTAGGSVFIGNSMQGNADFKSDTAKPDFSGLDGRIILWDAHARWQQHGVDVQAIYARGTIGDAKAIDGRLEAFNTANAAELPMVPAAFDGWLIQAGYTLWIKDDMSLAPFARYEDFDSQSEMPDGFSSDPANADMVLTAGMSFRPMFQVCLKADYQKFNDASDNDRFNFGLGYMF